MLSQVEFSDVILLNKADTVAAEQLEMMAGVLRSLNPSAKVRSWALVAPAAL